MARIAAFPLRKRTGMAADGIDWLLECGHITPPEPGPFMDDIERLPCILCYRDAMKRARWMIEGDEG